MCWTHTEIIKHTQHVRGLYCVNVDGVILVEGLGDNLLPGCLGIISHGARLVIRTRGIVGKPSSSSGKCQQQVLRQRPVSQLGLEAMLLKVAVRLIMAVSEIDVC